MAALIRDHWYRLQLYTTAEPELHGLINLHCHAVDHRYHRSRLPEVSCSNVTVRVDPSTHRLPAAATLLGVCLLRARRNDVVTSSRHLG